MNREEAEKRADDLSMLLDVHTVVLGYRHCHKSGYMAAWSDIQKEIKRLKDNCFELEKLCDAWMREYDKLKSKYEPTEVVTSAGKMNLISSDAVPSGELWFVDKDKVVGKIINIGESDKKP